MKNKNFFAIVLLTFLVFTLLCSCTASGKYDEDKIIGLRSDEVIALYGEFDNTSMPICVDGIYRNASCGYIIKDKQVGFLETKPAIYFMIGFDDNGIAFECTQEEGPKGV